MTSRKGLRQEFLDEVRSRPDEWVLYPPISLVSVRNTAHGLRCYGLETIVLDGVLFAKWSEAVG